jgi:polyphenol oxidase
VSERLRSPIFSTFDWIESGFGTRLDSLPQNEMASLKQIHSSVVLVADRAGLVGEGDALVTSQPGIAVSVRTADCYPILLADSRRHVVAAVHAGWRGTAARIVPEAIAKMRAQWGTEPQDIYAAIGPGIGACCYEVGADVARQFDANAGRLDLAEANRCQLLDSGVGNAHIDVLGLCTFCDTERFHSYRRDKEQAGRMVSFIRIAA